MCHSVFFIQLFVVALILQVAVLLARLLYVPFPSPFSYLRKNPVSSARQRHGLYIYRLINNPFISPILSNKSMDSFSSFKRSSASSTIFGQLFQQFLNVYLHQNDSKYETVSFLARNQPLLVKNV